MLHLFCLYPHAIILNREAFRILLKYVRSYHYCAQNTPMTFFLIVHSEGKLSPYDFIQGSARSGPITSMTSSLTISPLCILVQPQGFCTCCSHSQDYSWLLRFYSFPSIYSLLKCHLSEAFPGPPNKDYNTLHLTLLT